MELGESGQSQGGATGLDALQGVVGVTALPLHPRLAPAAGLRGGLCTVVLTDVIFVEQCQ